MDWHPNGKSLAVPTLQGVSLISAPESDSGDWSVAKLDEYKQEAYATHWSPNGRYLASGHADSHLLIWDANKRVTLDRSKCPEVPLSMQWNKTANALLVALANGRYAEWTGVVGRSLPDPVRPYDAASLAAAEYESQKQSLDAMFSDEPVAAPVEPAVPVVTKSSTPAPSSAASTAPIARTNSSAPVAPKSYASDRMDTDTSDVLRFESRSNGRAARDYMDVQSDDGDVGYGRNGFVSGSGGYSSGAVADVELQRPFMPSATQSGSQRRFLVWNSVGSIVARIEESPSLQTSMEMDFADTSLYKPFSVTQPLAIDLATLGPQGVLTSSQGFLQFQMFQKIGAKSDWAHKLNDGELAVSLAVGDHWSAVATNSRRLRLFGEAGVKLAVLSLPGPVVSMCAHGPLLGVFFHSGLPSTSNGLPLSFFGSRSKNGHDDNDEGSTQTIGWWIFHVASRRLVSSGSPLPLSSGSRLTWCGFSSEGNLCTFDSAGILRQLAGTKKFVPASTPLVSIDSRHAMSAIEPSWSDMWFEILDTNEHRAKRRSSDAFGDETYGADELEEGTEVWPIAVSHEKLRFAKCRKEDGPNVQPKPVPSYLPLAMPFGSGSERADSNENVAIRSVVSIGAAISAAIDTGLDVEGVLGIEDDGILPTDNDAKFVLDLASDKQILGAQAKLDGAVLKLLREASQEGRVERALGLAKTLVLKKSIQVAIQVASKTGQAALADRIDEWSKKREVERKKFSDATARMVAAPVASLSPQLLASLESQNMSLASDWASDGGRKNTAKRSSEQIAKSLKPASNGHTGGSDDEFEVEDEEDEDGEMPASKKFTTQAIDSDDENDFGAALTSKKNVMNVDDDDEETDENPALRGTNGSVFKSSPFSAAPPFAYSSGKLMDTISSIGKAKKGPVAAVARVSGAPFQSPKKNMKR